jgi:hypothetical protein
MHWLGPAILPLAILTVVVILAVVILAIEGLGRAALLRVHTHVPISDVDGGVSKMDGERQSRAPTAAGGDEEEAMLVDGGGGVHPRVSFVVDKALDGSVVGVKGYHHRLSLSSGTGAFTLARASAAFREGAEGGPLSKGVVISRGAGEGGSGAVMVHTTYGT